MNPVWVAFVTGLVAGTVFIGVPLGMLALALCVTRARADEVSPKEEPRPTVEVGRGHEHGGAWGIPRLAGK